jgi:putative FmdB family regulatory protein
MPLREYQCKKCKHRFEKIEKFSDKPLKKCPECGGPLEEVISAPAVQFKGSGWYVTDYARKGSGSTGSSSGESESGAKDGKETAKETKKEEKPKSEATSPKSETTSRKTKKE